MRADPIAQGKKPDPPWVSAIARSGGPETAVLWGPALKALLAELESARASLAEMTTARDAALAANTFETELREAREALRNERSSVIGLRAEIDMLKSWREGADAVLTVLRYLRDHEYLEPRIAAAMREADL